MVYLHDCSKLKIDHHRHPRLCGPVIKMHDPNHKKKIQRSDEELLMLVRLLERSDSRAPSLIGGSMIRH